VALGVRVLRLPLHHLPLLCPQFERELLRCIKLQVREGVQGPHCILRDVPASACFQESPELYDHTRSHPCMALCDAGGAGRRGCAQEGRQRSRQGHARGKRLGRQ
jgi:hypothetical protein